MVQKADFPIFYGYCFDRLDHDKEASCLQIDNGLSEVIGFITNVIRRNAVVTQNFRYGRGFLYRLQKLDTRHSLLF